MSDDKKEEKLEARCYFCQVPGDEARRAVFSRGERSGFFYVTTYSCGLGKENCSVPASFASRHDSHDHTKLYRKK